MISPIELVQNQLTNAVVMSPEDHHQVAKQVFDFLAKNNISYHHGYGMADNIKHVFEIVEGLLEKNFAEQMRNSQQPIAAMSGGY